MENSNRVEQVWAVYHNDCFIGSFVDEGHARECLALYQRAAEARGKYLTFDCNADKFRDKYASIKPRTLK